MSMVFEVTPVDSFFAEQSFNLSHLIAYFFKQDLNNFEPVNLPAQQVGDSILIVFAEFR